MNFKEACDILGVSSEVTEEKLKFFFHNLAKEYHPDVGGSEKMMKKLNMAYAILKKKKELNFSDDFVFYCNNILLEIYEKLKIQAVNKNYQKVLDDLEKWKKGNDEFVKSSERVFRETQFVLRNNNKMIGDINALSKSLSVDERQKRIGVIMKKYGGKLLVGG